MSMLHDPVVSGYVRALGFYVQAHDTAHTPDQRVGALRCARDLMLQIPEKNHSLNSLISMTRIWRDLGHRPACYDTAMHCGEFWSRNKVVDPTIPVLPLQPYHGSMVGFELDLWLNMTIIEQIDRFEAYSTMHRVERGQLLNDMLFQQRWHSLESERRLLLTNAVLNRAVPARWPASERLRTQSPNADIWSGAATVLF